MPLIKSCSIESLEKNIALEIRAGKPRVQAVAIAQRTLMDSCRDEGVPVPIRKVFDVINGQGTVGIRSMGKDAAEWVAKNEIVLDSPNSFIGESTQVKIAEGIVAEVAKRKHKKRPRTKEFLEGAFERARSILNPRDFAVIFQAARASAGGQISARNRRERLSAGELQLIDKVQLGDMSRAELNDISTTMNKSYRRSKKTGADVAKSISRAESVRAEFRRRKMGDPAGPVYVELNKQVKENVSKGFKDGEPNGGMHAHGLDRRNSKTLNDGGHCHVWLLPGSGDIIKSSEDGFHQHAIDGEVTDKDGLHSHQVFMGNGALLETKSDGAHDHELMIETSGFDGLHTHVLVLLDGTELESMSVAALVDHVGVNRASGTLNFASTIASAMNDLRDLRDATDAGGPLPDHMVDIGEAVLMAAKGEDIAPPVFAVEVADPDAYPGFDVEVGDIMDVRPDSEVVGFSKHVVPDDQLDIDEKLLWWDRTIKHTTKVPFTGPDDAKLLFISTAPNELELARKQGLVGDDSLTFEQVYLGPLNLSKSDVAIGFAMPVLPHGDDKLGIAMCDGWEPHLVIALKKFSNAKVVALGKIARSVLKNAGIEHWSLPHPSAVRKRGDSGEVARKLRSIVKSLDVGRQRMQNKPAAGDSPRKGSTPTKLTDAISEMRKTGQATCRVIKTADEKQIVYGVVLDPYEIDLQTEWVPPAEIESTAHGFLKKSRVIGFEHMERAEGQIVESWVEPYPSRADYNAAIENLPHRAFTRKFGDDVIHSGTWVAGVQLGDREWALHKQGKLNAFSVGGFSFKSKVTVAAMPEVEFIELIGSPA